MTEIKNSFRLQLGGFLMGLFILLGFPVIAQAIEYGGIGGRPAYPDPANPRTESIFVHEANTSEVIEEGIRLINNSAETKTLMVYAVDSTVSTDGAFACAQVSEAKKDVGAWINLEKNEVTLESLTNEIVPFTIIVPETAGVGEHNGCIVIQEKKAEPEQQGISGIRLTFRTGLRVAMLIPGEIIRELEIANFSYSKKDNGNFILKPEIKNLGNVSVDADVYVTTKYFFGSQLHRHGGQYPILRGEISTWNFELDKPFWGGWYKSSLTVSYDANPEAGVGIISGKELTNLTGSTIIFFSPPQTTALVIEIIVLVLIIFGILLLYLKRKRQNWMKREWVEYEVLEGDNIKSLGERYNVSWKLIIKANKLPAPYTLSSGNKIKLPPKK